MQCDIHDLKTNQISDKHDLKTNLSSPEYHNNLQDRYIITLAAALDCFYNKNNNIIVL